MPYADVEKKRACQRAWYSRNAKSEYQRIRRRKLELFEFIRSLKVRCAFCGYDAHPAALDFHHEGDKDITLAHAARQGWSRPRILAEVAKCVVLCANCHRVLHALEAQLDEQRSSNP